MPLKGTDRKAEPKPDRPLLEACLEALRTRIPVRTRGAGRNLHMRIENRDLRFAVETKRGLRRADVGPLIHRARALAKSGECLLVCAERVPDVLGAELREHGAAYLDLGGNAHLRGPGVFILIEGRPPVPAGRVRRALTGTDVRLLGVFLRDPDAGELVQTELAARAGVALGAVGAAREKLVALGLLERPGKRRWRVRDRVEGLRRFGEGWAAVVRHKLRPESFRLLEIDQHGTLEDRLRRLAPHIDCLLGGERAAGHLTRLLQTDHATLHAPRDRRKEIPRALMLVPHDEGPITLLDRYGQGDELRPRATDGLALAHPLLVWAECLLHPDERVAQAAERLHEDLQLFADLERAARDCKLTPCLIGAGAIQLGPDLAWGVRLSRRTRDWDFAVHVASWAEYEVLGNRLTAPDRGFHRAAEPHRFRHRAGGLLDVIPYGGLEHPPGTLRWPNGAVMDTAGLEVLDQHHESHRLGAIALRIASLPAVVGLKLLAYRSRRPAVTRDVADVHVILRDIPTSDERVADEALPCGSGLRTAERARARL